MIRLKTRCAWIITVQLSSSSEKGVRRVIRRGCCTFGSVSGPAMCAIAQETARHEVEARKSLDQFQRLIVWASLD